MLSDDVILRAAKNNELEFLTDEELDRLDKIRDKDDEDTYEKLIAERQYREPEDE